MIRRCCSIAAFQWTLAGCLRGLFFRGGGRLYRVSIFCFIVFCRFRYFWGVRRRSCRIVIVWRLSIGFPSGSLFTSIRSASLHWTNTRTLHFIFKIKADLSRLSLISMMNSLLLTSLSLPFALEWDWGFPRGFSSKWVLLQSRSDTSPLHKRFQRQTASYTPDRSLIPTASPVKTDTWLSSPTFSYRLWADVYRRWVDRHSILRRFAPSWWKLWAVKSKWCCSYLRGIWLDWWKGRPVPSCWSVLVRVFRTRVVLRGDCCRCSGWGWRTTGTSVCYASWGRLKDPSAVVWDRVG